MHPIRARHPSDPIIPKGTAAPIEGVLRVWACVLAAFLLGLPVFSPDLFWHLSSGRWIAAHVRIPRADPFSFTAAGAPWVDFEWGLQVFWYAVERVSGLWGLWAVKALTLVAAFSPVDGLLRARKASSLARVGALAFWCAAALAQADLRADVVSAFFFGVLLRRLEAGRGSFLFGFFFFALWANLHAGFVLGFFLYIVYAFAARLKNRPVSQALAAEAVGAALGSLLNPYGLGLYSILLTHASDPAMSRFVLEWGPPSWQRSFQLPLIVALAAFALAAWIGRRRAPKALLTVTLALGVASAVSARFGIFFASAGAALFFSIFPRPSARFVAAGLAAVSLLFVVPARGVRWGQPFEDRYVARRAVGWLAREEKILGSLRLFNQYEWGGYLGWRMGEDYKVFDDGRYLFHDRLPEIQEALSSSQALESMAQRRRLDGFLLKNYPAMVPSSRALPDGSRIEMPRPWHVFVFRRERWALVYWDDQALFFVDRARVPAEWLSAHEYRWLRPGDVRALSDALARGEVPRAALDAENARHRVEGALALE